MMSCHSIMASIKEWGVREQLSICDCSWRRRRVLFAPFPVWCLKAVGDTRGDTRTFFTVGVCDCVTARGTVACEWGMLLQPWRFSLRSSGVENAKSSTFELLLQETELFINLNNGEGDSNNLGD